MSDLPVLIGALRTGGVSGERGNQGGFRLFSAQCWLPTSQHSLPGSSPSPPLHPALEEFVGVRTGKGGGCTCECGGRR